MQVTHVALQVALLGKRKLADSAFVRFFLSVNADVLVIFEEVIEY